MMKHVGFASARPVFLHHLDQLMPSVDADQLMPSVDAMIRVKEKLSLREFCNLNDHGLYVLNYTIGLVEQAAAGSAAVSWLSGLVHHEATQQGLTSNANS